MNQSRRSEYRCTDTSTTFKQIAFYILIAGVTLLAVAVLQ